MSLADSGMAIGAVTRLVQDHLSRRGFIVSVAKPEDASNTDTTEKLNLYLYESSLEPHMRNQRIRESETPPLWLVLKFLMTAFDAGESSDTVAAHDLLGRGMSALSELGFLPVDAAVAPNVRLALENNPEPLKLTFDDAGVDLVAKIMHGSDERYRLSAAFQVRPVMIVPATIPRGSLLVGIDYNTSPETVIGADGVQLDVLPSLGPRIRRVEPERFEAGATLTVFGDNISSAEMELVLGDVTLTIIDRQLGRLTAIAESSPGTPIASGATLSAGEKPLMVRRRLSPSRSRSSNLLLAQLLPTVNGAALVGNDLQIQGLLLGTDDDDILILLYRSVDGVTTHRFDVITTVPNQQSLVVTGVTAVVPAGEYRVILSINNQQAFASPVVVFP